MPSDGDERERRAEGRAKRREQAAAEHADAQEEAPGHATNESADGDASGGEGAGPTVRTGATLAAAGALVGAAIGAASAIRSRGEEHTADDGQPGEPLRRDVEGRADDETSTAVDPEIEPDEPEGDRHEDEGGPESAGETDRADDDDREPEQGTPAWVMRQAREQLEALTGRDVEGVLALERTDGGWRAQVEVVELRRIPSTTDVLGVYDVELDGDGDVDHYRRTERYVRSRAGGGE
jgi:Gas vesicle synthesis protein GvpO